MVAIRIEFHTVPSVFVPITALRDKKALDGKDECQIYLPFPLVLPSPNVTPSDLIVCRLDFIS